MLEAMNLAIERNQHLLFEDVCMRFEPGYIVLCTGENGTGKTTLLKILAGLLPPTRGYISWQGQRVQDNVAQYLTGLVYLGHQHGLSPAMRVGANLDFLASLDGIRLTRAQQIALLKPLGLHDKIDTPLYQLSAGQIRKVALSRLWFEQRKNIWILDEPFTALDLQTRVCLQNRMLAFVKKGGLILLSSHQRFELPAEALKQVELAPMVA